MITHDHIDVHALSLTGLRMPIGLDQVTDGTVNKPIVAWMTGLSGAGKTTIAREVQKSLNALGHPTIVLDGDELRQGLNRDLGFTEADRVESIRRAAEVAHLISKLGFNVLVSLISPYKKERMNARKIITKANFIEIFIDTPLEVCQKRDPKGLYMKAKLGELKNFTGIDSPYQAPDCPDITIYTVNCSIADSASALFDQIYHLIDRKKSG